MSPANWPEYDELPEGIKAYYTRQEYAWMSDAQKAALLRRETEPDDEDIAE